MLGGLKNILVLIVYLLISHPLWANCIRVTSTSAISSQAIAAGYTAADWTGACNACNGNIGLPAAINISSDSSFQPAGTLLASAVGNFLTAATNKTYTRNQILFRCDRADAENLYEMYATNGANAFTGQYLSNEVDGAYYDVAKNVAVRMTNLSTGEYYSRYWKQRKITSADWYQDAFYIYIPASAFSNVLYEMYKISSSLYYFNAGSNYRDAYPKPRGYIAFKGPGLTTNSLMVGQDSASYYYGLYGNWPGEWSTYNNVTYLRGALCHVKDYPAVVILPPVSSASLQAGGSSQTSFSVSLECESGAVSGTDASTASKANVAMGFLVNQPVAVNAARALGLATSGGGLTWLLDSHYGNSGTASGVGIKILNQSGAAIILLPDKSATGSGNTHGWYGYQSLTSLTSSGTVNTYTGDFTASLEAISGQTVTPGTVNAQLQVIVSFQ